MRSNDRAAAEYKQGAIDRRASPRKDAPATDSRPRQVRVARTNSVHGEVIPRKYSVMNATFTWNAL